MLIDHVGWFLQITRKIWSQVGQKLLRETTYFFIYLLSFHFIFSLSLSSLWRDPNHHTVLPKLSIINLPNLWISTRHCSVWLLFSKLVFEYIFHLLTVFEQTLKNKFSNTQKSFMLKMKKDFVVFKNSFWKIFLHFSTEKCF